jgi:queuine tRNA-ribosyltransferase
MLNFEVLKTDPADGAYLGSFARRSTLTLNHGVVETPIFMPVGTYGTVKGVMPQSLHEMGAQIILGNTFHLWMRPGLEVMQQFGGLHRFESWNKPILTDSGGFQVMSLAGISKVKEEAVTFASHIDGSRHVLSPERSIEIQADRIGADISMQLDQCVSWPAEEPAARAAMELSVRWGARSKAAFGTRETQALFGIQQGSTFENLRRESSDRLQEIGFDGYAIGGLAVGEGHQAMCEVLDYAPDMLPVDRPRYLMGVGKPVDLVEAVWRGVDMFDCVLPTRAGRHGQAWTWAGPINLKNARFAEDQDPLEPDNPCPASQAYSKAYLHHLIRADEILGKVLLSWHNIAFFQALTAAMRDAIARHVRDGDTVVIEGFTHLICFAAGHEIIRQRRKDLTLARLTPDLIYDQMIAAGCARKLVFSWAGNPGVGSLHAFRRAAFH